MIKNSKLATWAECRVWMCLSSKNSTWNVSEHRGHCNCLVWTGRCSCNSKSLWKDSLQKGHRKCSSFSCCRKQNDRYYWDCPAPKQHLHLAVSCSLPAALSSEWSWRGRRTPVQSGRPVRARRCWGEGKRCIGKLGTPPSAPQRNGPDHSHQSPLGIPPLI